MQEVPSISVALQHAQFRRKANDRLHGSGAGGGGKGWPCDLPDEIPP